MLSSAAHVIGGIAEAFRDFLDDGWLFSFKDSEVCFLLVMVHIVLEAPACVQLWDAPTLADWLRLRPTLRGSE